MYTYDQVDRYSYTIKKNEEPFLEVEGWEPEVSLTVAALNFYEAAHQEHTCYVCGHTGKDLFKAYSGNYICNDPGECVYRADEKEKPT